MSDQGWNNAEISTLKQHRDFNVKQCRDNVEISTLKQRRSFNVAATSGLLRPFNFQIQPKFNVISTLRPDVVRRWDNVEMPAGSQTVVNLARLSYHQSCSQQIWVPHFPFLQKKKKKMHFVTSVVSFYYVNNNLMMEQMDFKDLPQITNLEQDECNKLPPPHPSLNTITFVWIKQRNSQEWDVSFMQWPQFCLIY